MELNALTNEELMSEQSEQETLLRERARAHELFAENVSQAHAALRQDVSRIDEQLAEVRRRAHELQVLVRRTPGPIVVSYHSATFPCGRVTGRGRGLKSFAKLLEGEATGRTLRRCTACQWSLAEAAARSTSR